ncbi:hypothetical protein Sulfitobl28_14400 [Sulfitobacter pontiacus]|nr:hypothetical protein Sulfitobl28_14400 [Sulfitobacter pontiacus]
MHVIVQPCGRIRHVGPTIHKLRHRGTWIGSNFFDQFVMRRPNMADSIAQIRPMAGRKLHLALHDRPEQILRGFWSRCLVAPIRWKARKPTV